MTSKTKVFIVGATGQTGSSIVQGLQEHGGFEITAFSRPPSIDSDANKALRASGVVVVAGDLTGPVAELVNVLSGQDVVISAIRPTQQLDQKNLATAAKEAGVKRFIPCGFITVVPPGGIMELRDSKEEVYNHVRQLYLPYTFIDVGWWYQIAFPRLASGKIDYAWTQPNTTIAGDGNVPSALTDLRDIGRYVAMIIKDGRTLNKMVLTYNTVMTQNEIWDVLEKLSGEKIERTYESKESVAQRVEDARQAIAASGKSDLLTKLQLLGAEYQWSWGIRGDNTPEYAKYLGYLTTKELYPDFKPIAFEDYLKKLLEGKAVKLLQADRIRSLFQGSPGEGGAGVRG